MTRNSSNLDPPKSTTDAKKKLHSIIIITLTKLFEMRIVAKSLSELANNDFIRVSALCFSSSISLKSDGVKEKNAISDADTKPEA